MGPKVHVPAPANRHERARAILERGSRRQAVAAIALGFFAIVVGALLLRSPRGGQIAELAACEATDCSVAVDLETLCALAKALEREPAHLRLHTFAVQAAPRLKTPAGVQLAAEVVAADPGQRYARVKALAATSGAPGFECPALATVLDAIR